MDVCDEVGDEAPEGWRRPIYVIQEHDATKLHWDLRMEHEGVLKSWAVTKEPPRETGVRRLAVETGDHKLGYASFEGVIPDGSYGAGPVKLWDRGTFKVDEWSEDKIVVHISGEKLSGKYVLVRLKKGQDERNWLFFKGKDR